LKKSTKNIASTVEALVTPVAAELGYEIWDVEYVKEGAEYILRITIDSAEGIYIEDCEKMHRAIDPVLDEADPIEEAYYLEVSSPGLERELRTDDHIYACEGWEVEIRLFAPIDGSKVFTGILGALTEDGSVTLETESGVRTFAKNTVAKITTVFHFDD
jgi:ribosome maturation factor RimP